MAPAGPLGRTIFNSNFESQNQFKFRFVVTPPDQIEEMIHTGPL
jgi:hypothetical protein